MFPGGELKRNLKMYGVPIIYSSDPELRDISLRPDGDKLLATFCSNCTRLMCLLQVSFGPSSISKTLYFSATLKDLRLLRDDPTVPTTTITRGLRGPPTILGGRTRGTGWMSRT